MICSKPNPLVAVLAKVCGGIASMSASTASRSARVRSDGKSIPIDPPTSQQRMTWAAAAAPAFASARASPSPSISIRVIAGVVATHSAPPAKGQWPARTWSITSDHPASSRRSGPVGCKSTTGNSVAAMRARRSGPATGELPSVASRTRAGLSRPRSRSAMRVISTKSLVPSEMVDGSAAIVATGWPGTLSMALPDSTSRAETIAPTRGASSSRSIRASTISPSSTSAARASPIPASYSHSTKRHTRAAQQAARLEQRQADDVRMAARQEADEAFGPALDRIAARLAHAFPTFDIPVDLGGAQHLEGDDGVGDADARLAGGADDADARPDMVPPSRQQAEHAAQIGLADGLFEDAAPDRDGGVAGGHGPGS